MRSLRLLFGGVLLAGCDLTGPEPVTVTFCAGQVVSARIAIRDDGTAFGTAAPWRIIGSADGKSFSFNAPRRLSMAFAESETAISSDLRMFQLTADELPKLNCLPSTIGAVRTYTGTVAGLATGRLAQIWLGSGLTNRGNGSFTVNNAVTGPVDLVSIMRVSTVVEKFIVRRGIDLPSGTVLTPLDYSSAEAVEPRLNTVTIAGAGGAPVSTFYRLVTTGTNSGLPAVPVNGSMTVASLPVSLQTPTDFYVLGVGLNSGGATPESRSVSMRFANPGDRTLTFGPALQTPTTSYSTTTAPAQARVELPVQSEYSARADITLSQNDEGQFRSVTITMTRAYRGAASSWNFETPHPASLTMRSVRLNPSAPTSLISYAASADFSSLFAPGDVTEITVREASRDSGVGAGPVREAPALARSAALGRTR